MTTAAMKLKTLVDNAQDFKDACDIKITGEDITARMDKAIVYGETLKGDIDLIIGHMMSVKTLLRNLGG